MIYSGMRDKIKRGYAEAMLWCNTVDAKFESVDMTASDPSPEALAKAGEDCDAFLDLCETDAKAELELYMIEHEASTFGHDFALSRNGHGAGFFDRGHGFPALQRLAKTFGTNTWAVNPETGSIDVLE